MSTPTSTAQNAASLVGASAPSRPGMARLTLVEMRKMVDTRSGKWLMGMIVGLTLAITAYVVFPPGDPVGRNFSTLFEVTLYPSALILPVLGILTVTTEWSQRTALTTFTLTPVRQRIVAAKILAAAIYAVLSVPILLAVSALGHEVAVLLGRTSADWSLGLPRVGQALLFQTLAVLLGVGFGLVFMNTPAAIVLSLLLPTVWQIVGSLVARIQDAALWLDVNSAMEPLSAGNITGQQWQHLATSSAVWILLPLVAGTLRLLRRELK